MKSCRSALRFTLWFITVVWCVGGETYKHEAYRIIVSHSLDDVSRGVTKSVSQRPLAGLQVFKGQRVNGHLRRLLVPLPSVINPALIKCSSTPATSTKLSISRSYCASPQTLLSFHCFDTPVVSAHPRHHESFPSISTPAKATVSFPSIHKPPSRTILRANPSRE